MSMLSDTPTVADVAADALAKAIIMLFEDGLDASLRSAEPFEAFTQEIHRFRKLAEEAISLTASLRTLVSHCDQEVAKV